MARTTAKKATRSKSASAKAGTSRRATRKPRKTVVDQPVDTKPTRRPRKVTKPTESAAPVTSRNSLIAFYSDRLAETEKQTHLVSNTAKYIDPLSSGLLCVDWLFNGGAYNGMGSVAGEEQSGKTTLLNHFMANSMAANSLFTVFVDAEGTLNPAYAGSIFKPYGFELDSLIDGESNPFRYYREHVIDPVFDTFHAILKGMPSKRWIAKERTWAYIFPKRDKMFAKVMEAYEVKPNRALSTEASFVCPTDYAGPEGTFFIDSFAAMVAESDDEKDEKSRQRAVEAQAFSQHLKRITARISAKGVILLGANQVRKIPGQVYGDPLYEPGGEALKFYTSQRARLSSRMSGMPGLLVSRDKESGHFSEPSVQQDGAVDLYAYKMVKNTKNKPGNPKKQSWQRVWISDCMGKAHGFDPVFDTFQYLLLTKQLVRVKKSYQFRLRPSVGAKRANMLNELEPFTELDFKRLIISEVFPSRDLIRQALEAMGLSRKVELRSTLFTQLKTDDRIMDMITSSKAPEDEEDYEDSEEL